MWQASVGCKFARSSDEPICDLQERELRRLAVITRLTHFPVRCTSRVGSVSPTFRRDAARLAPPLSTAIARVFRISDAVRLNHSRGRTKKVDGTISTEQEGKTWVSFQKRRVSQITWLNAPPALCKDKLLSQWKKPCLSVTKIVAEVTATHARRKQGGSTDFWLVEGGGPQVLT